MISWMFPCAAWTRRMASSDSTRSKRVSPMPMRMPVVHGTFAPAGVRQGLQAHRRHLVRRTVVRHALAQQPLRGGFQHDAHGRRHGAQRRDLLRRHGAGIEMRQQPGFLEYRLGGVAQVFQRGGVAVRRQPLARRPVTLFGLLAQGEQRLLAAQFRPPAAPPATPRPRAETAYRVSTASARRCSSGTRRGTDG